MKFAHALEAADAGKCETHVNNCSERGILLVSLAIVMIGGSSQTFKKTLKRMEDFADNRCFVS